jgi:hypothetical protein
LERFIPSERRDALIGDLLERLQGGRSAWWYWRQVVLAIFFQVVNDVRERKLSVLVAIVTGVVVLLMFERLFNRGAAAIFSYLGGSLWIMGRWIDVGGFVRSLMWWGWDVLEGVVAGSLIGVVWRSRRVAIATAFATCFATFQAVQVGILARMGPPARGFSARNYVAYTVCVCAGILAGGVCRSRSISDKRKFKIPWLV